MKEGRERAMPSSGGTSTCRGPSAEGRTRRPVRLEQREEDMVCVGVRSEGETGEGAGGRTCKSLHSIVKTSLCLVQDQKHEMVWRLDRWKSLHL